MSTITEEFRAQTLLESEADYAALECAVRELLIEKGVFSEADFWARLDKLERTDHTIGAKLVARAWRDEAFRRLLVADPKEAAWQLLGMRLPEHPEIAVLENDSRVHHVIVCTLCSCYPKAVLGLPPQWYKSFGYRARMVAEPRAVLAQFGTGLPEDVELRVVDSTADLRYLVLPLPPAGIEALTEEETVARVSRDMMIGVRVAG